MKKRLFSLMASFIMAISLVSVLPSITADAAIVKVEDVKSAYKTIIDNAFKSNEVFQYALLDMDKNGVPELIAVNDEVKIYTYINGKAKLLASGDGHYGLGIYYNPKTRKVALVHSFKIYSWGTYQKIYFYELSNGKINRTEKELSSSKFDDYITFLRSLGCKELTNILKFGNYLSKDSDGSGQFIPSTQKYTLIDNLKLCSDGHNYKSFSVKSTYFTKGYTAKRCETCGKIINKKATALLTLAAPKASATANSVKLTWNKVSGAKGYNVYQYKNNKWVKIKTTAANSYTVSKLKAASTYKFCVKPYRKSGSKIVYANTSKILTTTTKFVNVTGFKVASTNTSSVKLKWNKVANAKGYIIYKYNTSKKTWVRVATTKTNSNTYTVSKLSAGTTYKFAVKAYKTINNKEIASGSYPQLTTSTNPGTVKFSLTSTENTATIKWDKVKGASGYIVYYKTSNNGKWQKLKDTTGNSFTKENLKPDTTYYFTVKAYRKVGKTTYNGAFTAKSIKTKIDSNKETPNESNTNVTTTTKLPTVTNFKATTTANTAVLSWTKVNGADGYIIYQYNPTKGYERLKKTSSNVNNYTVSNLQNSTEYKFAIKAYKTVNGSEVLGEGYPQITVKTIMPSVTNFKADSTTNSVQLTWTKLNGVDGYVIYEYDSSKNTYVRIGKNNYPGSYTVDKLSSGTTYQFAIRAYKTVDGHEVLSPVFPTATTTTKLNDVTNISSVSTDNSVKLSWNQVSNAQGYIVYRRINEKWTRIGKSSDTSYTVKNLPSGQSDWYTVRPYKMVNGKEVLSNSFKIYKTTTNPAVVKFNVTVPAAGQIKYTWNKVNGATGYIVYYKKAANDTWHRAAVVNGTSYTKSGLSAGNYVVTVKAYKDYNGKTYNGAYTTENVNVKTSAK